MDLDAVTKRFGDPYNIYVWNPNTVSTFRLILMPLH